MGTIETASRPVFKRRGLKLVTDVAASAKTAGLRYVCDTGPGIRRIKKGSGFSYIGPDEKPVRDMVMLKRIRSLVIPPAWENVWICSDPDGHVQAVGRDAKGRKQYRYHARWRQVRDETKYDRLLAFGRVMKKCGSSPSTGRSMKRRVSSAVKGQGSPDAPAVSGPSLMRVSISCRSSGQQGLRNNREVRMNITPAALRLRAGDRLPPCGLRPRAYTGRHE